MTLAVHPPRKHVTVLLSLYTYLVQPTQAGVVPIFTSDPSPSNEQVSRIDVLLKLVQLCIIVAPKRSLEVFLVGVRLVQVRTHVGLKLPQMVESGVCQFVLNFLLFRQWRRGIPTRRQMRCALESGATQDSMQSPRQTWRRRHQL